MSENNYGSLMLKSVLDTSVDVTKIIAPGIYPVTQGNASAPDSVAGLLTVAPLPLGSKVTFERQDSSVVYSLINGKWEKPMAIDVGAVPATRKVNGHALSSDISITSQDIFNTQAVGIGANQDLNDYQTPGLYWQGMNANTSAALHYPENSAGALAVLKSAGITQVYYVYNSSRVWTRSKYPTADWTPWALEYNTQNKPSAADVGALSLSGGTLTGVLASTNREGAGSYAAQYDAKAPFFQEFSSTHTSEYNPLWKQKHVNTRHVWSGGMIVASEDFKIHYTDSSDTYVAFTFMKDGQFAPGSYANFDARYQVKGNYYTKTESDARYQQDTKLGTEVFFDKTGGVSTWTFKAPQGCVMTGFMARDVGSNSAHNIGGIYYKPIQRYRNGAWVTITG